MAAPLDVPTSGDVVPESVLEGVSGKAIEGRSLGQIAWLRLRRDKVAMAGGVIVILLILVAIFGPFLVQNPDVYHANLINPTFAGQTARSAGSASRTRLVSSRSPAGTCSAGSSTGPGSRCSSRSWPPRSR